ncbi:MAG TPA: hypothetical protein VNH84_17205, partial [Candidatus Saccharimonadales bacterium]|nr:hypothetical protein [Candidatus Saccharimonadales bacterium]
MTGLAACFLTARAGTQIGSAPYRASATGAGNSHSPVFSADGGHVAFVSQANNLATNDDLGPHLDLFVRDLAARNTVLVSVSTNGFGGANDNISLYSLSSNAQVIAFDTAANNLAAGDSNGVSDIFVRDRLAGTTRLVSRSADGTGSGNGPSSNPLLSEDGRYVIFESLASNLVPNDVNGTNDVFIHDLTTGLTELVSVNTDGTGSAGGPSFSPAISADGQTVAFLSQARDVVNLLFLYTNFVSEVYVRRMPSAPTQWAGASQSAAAHEGFVITGAYDATEPALSRDGRYVAFKTSGQVARFDLLSPRNATFLSFTNHNQGVTVDYLRFYDNPRFGVSASATPLSLTPEGRHLAFQSSSNLTPSSGIVLADFETLVTNVFQTFPPATVSYTTNVGPRLRIVVTNAGPPAAPTWRDMTWLSLAADASQLFFLADATNLVAGLTNRSFQLYGSEAGSGAVSLLSTNAGSTAGPDLATISPATSPDGSLIGWDSPDDNIVADDLNRAWDVFVRGIDTGDTQLVSARHPALPASSGIALSRLDSNPRALSGHGRRIAVLSLDNALAPSDTNSWRDLFVRDVAEGVVYPVTHSGPAAPPSYLQPLPGSSTVAAPSLSVDGQVVCFATELSYASISTRTNRGLYWRDLSESTNRLIVAGNQLDA